jgi:DNA processing protein
MGCGLSIDYPKENADLFAQIVAEDRGAIVSELPMRFGVLSKNFPRRNRIISGMSLGVLVVEAARRSGSLGTARLAVEQNREVLAVPGRVDSATSQGTNELIRRSHAGLVQNLDDVLEALGRVGEAVAEENPDGVAPPPAVELALDETERKLMAALREEALSLDVLARRTELPSGKVASSMTMLVLKGAVEQRPGNVFARKR